MYRGVLGRDPESAEVIDNFVRAGLSLEEMISQAIRSDEFTNGRAADLGRYKGPIIPRLIQPNLPREAGAARMAVLIRTHVMDGKFHHLWDALHGGDERRLYDVLPLLDAEALGEAQQEIDDRHPSAIWITPDDLREAGLTQRSEEHRNLWLLGDAAMYLAVLRQPAYDYYVMVDYDVHFTGDAVAYLNRLCQRLLAEGEEVMDGVGLDYSPDPTPATGHRDWPFWAPAAKAFALIYHFYLPVVAVSRRGLLHCFAGRQLEAARRTPSRDLVNGETFLPSSLKAAGFACADLNAVLPGSYQITSMSMQHVHPGRMSGLPLSRALAEPEPGVEMVHGVYSDEHFLARNLSIVWSSPPELEMYMREVRSQYDGRLDPELLDDYVGRAQRRRGEL